MFDAGGQRGHHLRVAVGGFDIGEVMGDDYIIEGLSIDTGRFEAIFGGKISDI